MKTIKYFSIIAGIVLFILVGAFLIIPNWCVEQKFGDGYYLMLISSGNSEVVFRNKYLDNSYKVVVNDPVKSCAHDKKWIILKTKKNDYFVINKKIQFDSNNKELIVTGPLDSTSFYTMLSNNSIGVRLRTIKQDDL